MKTLSLATVVITSLVSIAAYADDVTLTLNGGKVSSPSCETEVQAIRRNGAITLYLNGGDYCNYAQISHNGKSIGSKQLPKLFGAIAGDSVDLPEAAGQNDYVIDFSGKGRADRIFLSVKKIAVATKVDVKINMADTPAAELAKCGGTVSMDRDTLGDTTVVFSGIDSCQFGTLLSKNGAPITPAVNFNFDRNNGGSVTRTIGRETLQPGTNTLVYKLWSKPTAEGVVIRETVEVTIN
jgi:hypothetical protein